MNRKGSSAVFLLVILSGLMVITAALIGASREASDDSVCDGLVSLAGDSVMSEYDRDIAGEYGLFMLKGTDLMLTLKLSSYLDHSLDSMEGMDERSYYAGCSGFPVTAPGEVSMQIREHMRYDLFGKPPKAVPRGKDNPLPERHLRHGPTISSLPSELMDARTGRYGAASGMDSYIMSHFNNLREVRDGGHFFRSEVEYILEGRMSDGRNEKAVGKKIKAMRIPLNLAHIYRDPVKRQLVVSAAQAMTPGPVGAATQLALAAAWAEAESDNDVELLQKGYRVPLAKDRSSWATDLDGVLEGITGKTIVPEKVKGKDYGHYLRILLLAEGEKEKTMRILDLIQINTRKERDRDFLICEYGTGIDVRVSINGRDYRYEKRY